MHIWILISTTQLLKLVEINECMATRINIYIQLYHREYWQIGDEVRGDQGSHEQRNSLKAQCTRGRGGQLSMFIIA